MDPKLIISYSTEPWVQVDTNLYIGGTYKLVYTHGGTTVVYNEPEGFDAVVSVANCGAEKQVKGALNVVYPFIDGQLDEDTIVGVTRVASLLVALLGDGAKVLVRCRAGCNRSALVAAMAIRFRQFPSYNRSIEGIIESIRAVRSCALCNPFFEKFLLENYRKDQR